MQSEALAAEYLGYYCAATSHLAALAEENKKIDERKMGQMLAMVAGIRPRDQLESMLAVQMAAVHSATIKMAWRLNNSDTLEKNDSYERAMNKLARTFAAQIDTLKRYRGNGEQKVKVEHVHVHEGGQAVVGNVSHGGRG